MQETKISFLIEHFKPEQNTTNGDGAPLTSETIYLCIFLMEQGEKIAGKVTARVPQVGEVIRISEIDIRGDYEVLKELQRTVLTDHEVVTLQVRGVIPREL